MFVVVVVTGEFGVHVFVGDCKIIIINILLMLL